MESRLKSILYLIKILIFLSFVSCAAKKDGGFAPSEPTLVAPAPTTPAPAGNWESELNLSEKITTPNGWEAVLDTNDISEYVVLTNGWKVEISND